MNNVYLHGHLEKFGKEWNFEIGSPQEAVRALSANLGGEFDKAIHEGYYKFVVGSKLINKDELILPLGKRDLHIVPTVEGAGPAGLIIAGVGLGVAGYALGYSWLLWTGVSLALGGISQLLTPVPVVDEINEVERKPSYYFTGAQNLTKQGHPVPIGYGEMIIGSQTISVGISTKDYT